MRYLLMAIGTRGDVEPFLAAGELLQSKGHEVHCLFPAQFEALTIGCGLSFHPLDKRFLELLETEAGRNIMGQKGSRWNRIRQLIKLAVSSMKLQKVLVQQQDKCIKKVNPDRILFHPKAVFGRIWGMANPSKSWILSPVPNILHPTSAHPQIGINLNLGKWGNRMTYRLTNYVNARLTASMAKPYRQDYPAVSYSVKSISRYATEVDQVLYTISPVLYQKPPEWPARAHICGYLERNKTRNWTPSQALSSFLQKQKADKRPVCLITFGSMVNAKPGFVSKEIVKVIEQSPYAAIINTSSGGLRVVKETSDKILFVSDIPYDYIFPKVHAVVHHGGSGTTHTALKHACSSLVIPHIIDQFFWNKQVAALGAGPLGVKISKLNAENFAPLLTDLMENTSYKQKAKALSKDMKAESPEAVFEKINQRQELA